MGGGWCFFTRWACWCVAGCCARWRLRVVVGVEWMRRVLGTWFYTWGVRGLVNGVVFPCIRVRVLLPVAAWVVLVCCLLCSLYPAPLLLTACWVLVSAGLLSVCLVVVTVYGYTGIRVYGYGWTLPRWCTGWCCGGKDSVGYSFIACGWGWGRLSGDVGVLFPCIRVRVLRTGGAHRVTCAGWFPVLLFWWCALVGFPVYGRECFVRGVLFFLFLWVVVYSCGRLVQVCRVLLCRGGWCCSFWGIRVYG